MLVIARSTITDLVEGINQFAGPMSFASRDVTRVNILVDGKPLICGQEGQWAFLFDLHYSFPAMMYTPLLNISRKLQASVMSFRIDSSCDAVEFFSAECGEISRVYLQRPEGFTKAYSSGTPFSSEALRPIGDVKGAGLNAILRSVGFERMDFAVGLSRVVDDQIVLWKGSSDLVLTEELPLDLPEHVAQFGIEQPELKIGLQFRLLTEDEHEEG